MVRIPHFPQGPGSIPDQGTNQSLFTNHTAQLKKKNFFLIIKGSSGCCVGEKQRLFRVQRWGPCFESGLQGFWWVWNLNLKISW